MSLDVICSSKFTACWNRLYDYELWRVLVYFDLSTFKILKEEFAPDMVITSSNFHIRFCSLNCWTVRVLGVLKISTVIKVVHKTVDHGLTLYPVPVRPNMSVILFICQLHATHLMVTVLPVFLIMDVTNSELYWSSGKHFGFSSRVNTRVIDLIMFKIYL